MIVCIKILLECGNTKVVTYPLGKKTFIIRASSKINSYPFAYKSWKNKNSNTKARYERSGFYYKFTMVKNGEG